MELKRDEIIKALECCITVEFGGDCPFECPFAYNDDCENLIFSNALALIKELTEEVVDLKAIAEGYQKQFEDCAEDRARLTEENERLKAENEIKSQKRANIFEITNAFERGRTDGVQKMQTALKEYYSKSVYRPTQKHPVKHTMIEHLLYVVDQIAKEKMEGERDGT